MYVKAVLLCMLGIAVAQENFPPQPYSFSFDSTDEFGTRLTQTESGDEGNRKTGTYGYQSADGTYRKVDYVADENGFRATVDTNEPGTKAESPADVQFNANPQPNPVGAPVAAPVVARPVARVVAAPQAVAYHAVQSPSLAYHAVPLSVGHAGAPTLTFAAAPHHAAPLTFTLGRAASKA
ncbi:cuticle protein 16.8-like [Ornithodoros turicata]|uniref:cuticle protein 16.8-like n=1 Tax=Ornithodoros turicata TaxID=34597 RepID=UPI003138B4CE